VQNVVQLLIRLFGFVDSFYPVNLHALSVIPRFLSLSTGPADNIMGIRSENRMMLRSRPIALALTASFFALALLGAKSPPAPVPAPPAWNLVWSDDFDGQRIDPKKWNIADRAVTNYDGGINSYDPGNVYLENGCLVIRSQCQNADRQLFNSGRVTTKGKFSFLYGKVEIRAQLPGTQGMWPALWLLPYDGSWPPELDMMELLGNDPTRIYMTHHWGKRKEDLSSQTDFAGPDFTRDFHLFSIEWEPNKIRWLIDGQEKKLATEHVPNKAMYLILNTSVGGDWPGMPDDSSVFPAFMKVDYVKVYQHPKKRR
jgi:beta-glucanase (GH16 family)